MNALETEAARAYTAAAEHAAAAVISRYSTSFGLATRLLHGPARPRTRSVYAMVRVADEIVDGAASGCGLDATAVAEALDAYERDIERALDSGFSTDLVIHAFADAARATGIGPDLTRPFFASMRADLTTPTHTPESFAAYVYGSAEVVGLMCLRVFSTDRSSRPVPPDPSLVAGARSLGAAFQKVNFLRDLRADDGRGRAYFPGIDPTSLTDAQKDRLLDDIDADLADSRAALAALPASSRSAVALAHEQFRELSARLRATPAAVLRGTRVRVPGHCRVVLVARVLAGRVVPQRGGAKDTSRRHPKAAPRHGASDTPRRGGAPTGGDA